MFENAKVAEVPDHPVNGNGLAPTVNHPFGSLATPREKTWARWAHGFASSSRDEFAHSRMRS